MKNKIAVILMGLLMSGTAAWSTLITDDFNRADTGYTTDGSVIGTGWVGNGNGSWQINSNVLEQDTSSNPTILYNTGATTVSGDGSSFTLSADVAVNLSGGWAGLVFNYLDNQNYYVLRIKGDATNYQLLSYKGGVQAAIRAPTASEAFVAGNMYTFTITSDTANDFDFTITAAGSSTVLNAITNGVDETDPLSSGGYAGFYSPSGGTAPESSFDNFSLEAIPEPATLSLFGVSAAMIMLIRRRLRS